MLEDRIDAYKEIERKRNSKLLVYATSDRPNMGTQIGADIHSIFTEHLDKIGDVEKISLILYTRGGNTLAAWTLVNLLRNFCKELEVIVPFNCHSAGTLICLGANRIIMTKQATLGPIDPSVTGALNPPVPGSADPNARVPISVEFIDSYVRLAKEELGIKDEQALAQILIELSKQVHPLTLGQVYKSKYQIKMLAQKLLSHQDIEAEKQEQIIDFLCSESGSHDYTMDRREALEIGLNIEKPDMDLYHTIKDIYDDIEQEMELRKPYNPLVELGTATTKKYSYRRALIESLDHGANVFITEGSLTKQPIAGTTNHSLQDNRIFEGWKHEPNNS